MGRSDWLLLLMPGLIWGSSFFFIAECLDAFQPALITPLRVLFGFLALVALPQSRKHIPIKDLPSIALLGVFWMVIPLSLFPFAEQHVSSSVTGMLNGATPLFVATVASLMHKSFPHRNQLLGLLVGFCGVLLIAIPTANNNSSSKFGVALIMCALCCYGIALNLAVPLQKKRGTGIAYALATTLAGRVGSTRTSVTTYIVPVVALFLGAIVRDEVVAGLALAGCGVALAGAFLTNRSRK